MGRHTSFTLFRDHSSTWFAAPPRFRNLLRDPIGRGETRDEAKRELLTHPEFIHRAKLGEWPLHPSAAHFVEVVRDGIGFTSPGSSFAYRYRNGPDRRQTLTLVWNRDA